MGNGLDLLVETSNVEVLTTAMCSEGIAVEMEIEQLPDFLLEPMPRRRLSQSELVWILKFSGIVSVGEDVCIFAEGIHSESPDDRQNIS